MAVLQYYKPEFHNYYIYDGEATREDGVPSVETQAIPIGLNPECFAAHMDFTGVALRPQRMNNIPTIGGIPYGWDSSSINSWNPGWWAATLVSPQHAIVSGHYYCDCTPFCDADPPQNSCAAWGQRPPWPQVDATGESTTTGNHLVFMNADGEYFVRKFHYIPRSELGGLGDAEGLLLEEPIPDDSGIKIYNKIFKLDTNQIGCPFFSIDPQSRAYVRKFSRMIVIGLQDDIPLNRSLNIPDVTALPEDFFDTDQSPGAPISGYGAIHVHGGDSGTPVFVQTKEHGTMLASAPSGGPYSHCPPWRGEIQTFNTYLDNFNSENGTDYSIELIDFSDDDGLENIDNKLILPGATEESYETQIYANGKKLLCEVEATGTDGSVDVEFSNTIEGVFISDPPNVDGPINIAYGGSVLPEEMGFIYRGAGHKFSVSNLGPASVDDPVIAELVCEAFDGDDGEIVIDDFVGSFPYCNGCPLGTYSNPAISDNINVPVTWAEKSSDAHITVTATNSLGIDLVSLDNILILDGRAPENLDIQISSLLAGQSDTQVVIKWDGGTPTPTIAWTVYAAVEGDPVPDVLIAGGGFATPGEGQISVDISIPCEAVGKNIWVLASISNPVGLVDTEDRVNPNYLSALDMGAIVDSQECQPEAVVHDIIVGGDGPDAFRFHPSALTGVNVGDVIRWTWGGAFHNVVAGECVQEDGSLEITCTASGKWWNTSHPDPPPNNGTSEIGHTFEWPVENDLSTGESPSGQTIHYYCHFHGESFGMGGSITVL